jgi:poly-gamma-glutamate capsule biosynthesis protein CapA/YwtB (metallophosphatase superfamily)
LDRIAPYTRTSAIAFCNCEWPLTDRGAPWPGKAGRVVRSPPRMIEAYTFAGFHAVGLANNHVMNYGAEGLAQTLELLDQAGIAHCGAGHDLAAAHAPAIVERQGMRIAFLSYTSVFAPGFDAGPERPGMAVVRVNTVYKVPPRLHEMPGSPLDVENHADPADVDRVLGDITAARNAADAVVLSWHWGVSMGYQHLVPYQVELGHMAIEAGADLIVGHHPHTVQAVEQHNGRLIAYSVGHCGFDMRGASFSRESLLVEVPLRSGGFEMAGLRALDDSVERPCLATGDAARRCHEWLARLSAPLGTRLIEHHGLLRATADKTVVRLPRQFEPPVCPSTPASGKIHG